MNKRSIFLLTIGFLCIVATGILLKNVIVKPSPLTGLEAGELEKISAAVSNAIKSKGGGYAQGETETEGHIILSVQEENNIIKVYTVASYGAFGFENEIFTKISGSGAIPTVMIFSKGEDDDYNLLEYKEPQDGSLYIRSIKNMFPKALQRKALSADKYYSDLSKQQEAQAHEYLKNIGRDAKVSADHVEKKLPNINVEASNKLFAELTKYNHFLNNSPYWIGTRELLENGVRYVYETSQSKTSDGYDLITFRKLNEDKTVIEEYKYKIVGSEPKLIGQSNTDSGIE